MQRGKACGKHTVRDLNLSSSMSTQPACHISPGHDLLTFEVSGFQIHLNAGLKHSLGGEGREVWKGLLKHGPGNQDLDNGPIPDTLDLPRGHTERTPGSP